MGTIIGIIAFLMLGSAAVAGMSAAPWLPTLPSQRKHLLDHLKLDQSQSVIDLGCGDGSLLFAIARRYPNLQCIGYEISLFPLAIAWLRKLWSFRAYRHVHIRFGNLFKQNISQADVIFIFLLNRCYHKLVPILQSQLKPSARVVVEAWPLPELHPSQVLKAESLLPVYVYPGTAFRD